MSEPPMISPWQPHGHDQRRMYVHVSSIVPRSTTLSGVPKRIVAILVSTTIVSMLPTAGSLYAGAASRSAVTDCAARAA